MDIKIAAEETKNLMKAKKWPLDARMSREADGYDHIEWMLVGIIEGYIQYEKAHRWLSWAQACIFIHQQITLKTFKEINKASYTTVRG